MSPFQNAAFVWPSDEGRELAEAARARLSSELGRFPLRQLRETRISRLDNRQNHSLAFSAQLTRQRARILKPRAAGGAFKQTARQGREKPTLLLPPRSYPAAKEAAGTEGGSGWRLMSS